jgi:ribosomal protein S18 acetylase RimI-like enzyme
LRFFDTFFAMSIAIDALTPDKRDEAARVLASAFVTNPLHVAVFGKDRLPANEAFFRIGLNVMKGQKLAAADDGRILGVIHWVDSPDCRFSTVEKLRVFPEMANALGLRSATRVARWLSVWSKWDLRAHHSHLGPIGVLPEAQGRGIGRRLMEQYCERLDGMGSVGYLETDRLENVDFYKRFGFEVTGTVPIQGVVNYFMRRSSRH